MYSPQLHTFTSRFPLSAPELLSEVEPDSFMAHPDRNRPAATLVARVKATNFFN